MTKAVVRLAFIRPDDGGKSWLTLVELSRVTHYGGERLIQLTNGGAVITNGD